MDVWCRRRDGRPRHPRDRGIQRRALSASKPMPYRLQVNAAAHDSGFAMSASYRRCLRPGASLLLPDGVEAPTAVRDGRGARLYPAAKRRARRQTRTRTSGARERTYTNRGHHGGRRARLDRRNDPASAVMHRAVLPTPAPRDVGSRKRWYIYEAIQSGATPLSIAADLTTTRQPAHPHPRRVHESWSRLRTTGPLVAAQRTDAPRQLFEQTR